MNCMLLGGSCRLQTACSGTDSPAIALSLVQELMTHLTLTLTLTLTLSLVQEFMTQEEGSFGFEHVMSCEIEPFKQEE